MQYEEIVSNIYKTPFPFEVMIECNGRCNLNCVHCYLGESKSPTYISLEKLDDILQQLSEMGTSHIKLTGGEPLLHPQFTEMLQLLRKHKMTVTLFTNATLINQDNIDLISMHVKKIQISMYGYTQKSYESVVRVPGSFKRFRNALNLLHKNNVPVNISIILLKENFFEHESMYEYCKEMSFKPNAGLKICPTRSGCYDTVDHQISEAQFVEAIKYIATVNNVEFDKFRLTDCSDFDGYNEDSDDRHPCGAGVYSFAIRSNGDVVPCIELSMVYGNIYQDSLKNIYNNDISSYVKNLKLSDYKLCTDCNMKNICNICLDSLFQENGHLYPTKNCKICRDTKLLYDNLIQK